MGSMRKPGGLGEAGLGKQGVSASARAKGEPHPVTRLPVSGPPRKFGGRVLLKSAECCPGEPTKNSASASEGVTALPSAAPQRAIRSHSRQDSLQGLPLEGGSRTLRFSLPLPPASGPRAQGSPNRWASDRCSLLCHLSPEAAGALGDTQTESRDQLVRERDEAIAK